MLNKLAEGNFRTNTVEKWSNLRWDHITTYTKEIKYNKRFPINTALQTIAKFGLLNSFLISKETVSFMGEFYGPWASFFLFWASFKLNIYIKIAVW